MADGGRSPVELARAYIHRVYENHEYELVREIFSDPMIRHDPNGVVVLTHDEQIARLEKYQTQMGARFENITIHGDDEYVTVVYNMHTTRGRPYEMCSIETWRVQDGRITECWNSPYVPGKWGDPDIPETLEDEVSEPHIVKDVANIDRDWVTSVLRHAGIDAPRVELVNVERMSGGNACTTLRLAIDYNAEPGDTPQSMVCKLTPENPHMAMALAENGANTTELEALQLFTEERVVNAPSLYFGDVDEFGFYATIAMQDLSVRATIGDQINGVTTAQATALCRQLKNLHTHFWQSPRLQEFTWLNNADSSAEVNGELYIAGAARVREYFGSELPEEYYRLIDAFVPQVKSWLGYKSQYRTLIHADARALNVLFEEPREGEEQAWLIDWQVAAIDDPQRDLAYFMSTSVTTEDRRAIERALIGDHASAIGAIDPSYTLEIAEESYRFYLPHGMYGAVASVAFASSDTTREILAAWLPRSCAAVLDWDSLPLVQERLNKRQGVQA